MRNRLESEMAKHESTEDSVNLNQRSAVTLSEDLPPSPRLWRDKPSRRLLAEIVEDLQAVLAQFAEIANDLKPQN
jgi:hypothetical protein